MSRPRAVVVGGGGVVVLVGVSLVYVLLDWDTHTDC